MTAVQLYKVAIDASNKYFRNRDKVLFMSLSTDVHAFTTWGDDLTRYHNEMNAANAAFAVAVAGMSAHEIVAIITEATA